jgi:hypothetical protein
MTPDEERRFVAHVFSKGGYCTPQYWPTYPMPLLTEQIPSVDGKADPMRQLMIFRDALFPQAAAVSEEWKQYWRPGGKYTGRTRPGFEFTRPCVDGNKLFPGRLWMGASAYSFSPPSSGSRTSHQEAYKGLEAFYRACYDHLRKNLSKLTAGWYVGGEVEDFCTTRGLSRAPSTHL